MRKWMMVVVPVAALFLGTACGDKDDGDSGTSEGADGADGGDGGDGADGGGDAAAGASVYTSSCSGCHGAEGEGVSAPAMGTVVPGKSAADIAEIAMNGTGSMPAILSGNQTSADDVAAYCVETWGN